MKYNTFYTVKCSSYDVNNKTKNSVLNAHKLVPSFAYQLAKVINEIACIGERVSRETTANLVETITRLCARTDAVNDISCTYYNRLCSVFARLNQ